MGGRGASSSSSSSTSSIKTGTYTYTKNGGDLEIKVLDVKGSEILVQVAGYGPSGGFYNGNKVIASPDSELIKGMKRKNKNRR